TGVDGVKRSDSKHISGNDFVRARSIAEDHPALGTPHRFASGLVIDSGSTLLVSGSLSGTGAVPNHRHTLRSAASPPSPVENRVSEYEYRERKRSRLVL